MSISNDAAFRALIHANRALTDALESMLDRQAAAPPASPPDDLSPPPPTGCSKEIIETLRAVGHRLTGRQLAVEMAARGYEYRETTIREAAALLVELGVLANRQDTNPRGYGLPEWA